MQILDRGQGEQVLLESYFNWSVELGPIGC